MGTTIVGTEANVPLNHIFDPETSLAVESGIAAPDKLWQTWNDAVDSPQGYLRKAAAKCECRHVFAA